MRENRPDAAGGIGGDSVHGRELRAGGGHALGIGGAAGMSLRAVLAASLLAGLTGGCAMVHDLRGAVAKTEAPAPRPAASADDAERPPPPMLSFVEADADDSIVRVLTGSVACTGTLIEDNLVLTAHHCVTQRDRYGDILPTDADPKDVLVELGGDYLPWGEVGVLAIVAPQCGHAAGPGDIAILVLDRHLLGVQTMRPRLHEPPRPGTFIDPVGFGRCALSREGIRRRARAGGRIDEIGSTQFRLDASICPGDSGGPGILRETGEIVGVISASAMDGREDTAGRTELTRLDRWRSVFATAKLVADGASLAELPPIDGCPEE